MKVVLDPPGDPESNMAADQRILGIVAQTEQPNGILRIYRWDRPAISLGRRQRSEDLPASLSTGGLPFVRRPTGGGAVLHRMDELTYALAASRKFLPAAGPLREIPVLLHRCLRDWAVGQGWVSAGDLSLVESDPSGPAPLCFEAPAWGDLLFRGRKVAGAALRVWKEEFLLQGSLQGFPVRRDHLRHGLIAAVRKSFGEDECGRRDLNSQGLRSYAEAGI